MQDVLQNRGDCSEMAGLIESIQSLCPDLLFSQIIHRLNKPEKWFFSTFSWKDLLTNAYVTTLYISGDFFLSYSSYLSQVRFKGGEEVWVEKVFQLNVCDVWDKILV